MTILQIIATGILCAVLALTIKKQSPEIALLITIAASVLLFVMVLPELAYAIGVFTQLGEMLEGGARYVGLVLRVIGIAYMAELGASVCMDAGESAIAAKIDMAGRLIILVMAMPIVIDIAGIVIGLLP
ncbi:MAG: stage III sporulation protein AD [Defluviitaleaceae bacterium]|nr:stage III sporulation protein AD [Defluviitaleaceae bacterium]MCL2239028.1 stage III sporulation protein AD [Defluviitaleaceae bacterium]